MTDVERLYRESQEAILSLITVDNANTTVPACPGWNLQELLGHLTGALIDLSTGKTDGAPSPAWTASHLERYRNSNIGDIANTWRDATESDMAISLFQHMGANLLPDIVTHEFDVRGALHNTDRRNADGLLAVYPVVVSWLDSSFRAKDLPGITLGTEIDPVIIGDGKPQASVSTTVFELSRVITGRRSPAQVRDLEWSVDPSPWIEHLSVLGQRESDLIE